MLNKCKVIMELWNKDIERIKMYFFKNNYLWYELKYVLSVICLDKEFNNYDIYYWLYF